MAKINILSSSVYNLISAGEVVERPASVVKELLENSIDAGSKNISIEIKDGGTSFIEVADDGSGIEKDDIKSAFLPHATSKIKEAADLDSILTLGFRGEALASIAAVAKVKLVSRTAADELATSVIVEGGQFGEISFETANVGTKITVRDLFFCVPARLKFLKKNKTEEQEITNIVTRTILAHPELNIVYTVDGKRVYASHGTTHKEAMFVVYGKESVTETIEVKAEKGGMSVFGFVGKPTYSKSNRTYQTLIVNGRYVINLTVQTAVTNAYGDYLMKRQYPFFVLYLSVPPEEVDVNVHPNKLDVKFANSGAVYSLVFEAVSRGLAGMDYVKDIGDEMFSATSSSASFGVSDNKKSAFSVGHISYDYAKGGKIDKAGVEIPSREEVTEKLGVNKNPFSGNLENASQKQIDMVIDGMMDMNASESDTLRDNFGLGSKLLERITRKMESGNYDDPFEDPSFVNSAKKNKESFALGDNDELKTPKKEVYLQDDFASDEIKIIGKAFNTYLIVEWGENLYLFDQHAVHERLRYEKLKAEYETGSVAVQPLLVPYVLSLNAEDDQIIRENMDAISSLGFEIDEFGDMSYKISSVPAIVSDMDFGKFFSMFVAEKIGKSKMTSAELVKDKLMQMACKSSIKGGDDLTKTEILKLLHDMGNEKIILFCPHGRPVVVKITKSEIEKWFKRIV